MPKTHTVVQGECLSSIAAAEGFANWQTIYNNPANADFRQLRPNPNILFPGDEIVIPDKAATPFDAATGQSATFTVKSAQTKLVLRPADPGSPNYDLAVDGVAITSNGRVPSTGLIEVPIAATAASATFTIWPDGFSSADDAGDAATTWTMQLGGLNPADTISGVQARLANLGYDPGPIDGEDGPLTQAAVSAFQDDNPPLMVNGICGPNTRPVLVKAYGM